MNNKTINFMMFVMGAAIGSVATWQYVKKRYEQIAQEEIDSVKETFSRKNERKPCMNGDTITIKNGDDVIVELVGSDVKTKASQAKEKPGIVEYTEKLRKLDYTNYSKKDSEDKKKESDGSMVKPYIITPEEFGDLDDYETISLTYYSDQILTDDDDEIVEDVEGVVGLDSLNHFGEYEDDSVFVRNDDLKGDYEILRDQRKYSDVVKKRPHRMDE